MSRHRTELNQFVGFQRSNHIGQYALAELIGIDFGGHFAKGLTQNTERTLRKSVNC